MDTGFWGSDCNFKLSLLVLDRCPVSGVRCPVSGERRLPQVLVRLHVRAYPCRRMLTHIPEWLREPACNRVTMYSMPPRAGTCRTGYVRDVCNRMRSVEDLARRRIGSATAFPIGADPAHD